MNELKGHKVLLVDDEPRVREAIAWLFEALGAQVVQAGSVTEALSVFRPGVYALVSTDYAMPGSNGLELIEAVHRMAPDQKMILISGYVDQLRSDRILNGRVRAVLPKPCSLADLAATMHRLGFPDQSSPRNVATD